MITQDIKYIQVSEQALTRAYDKFRNRCYSNSIQLAADLNLNRQDAEMILKTWNLGTNYEEQGIRIIPYDNWVYIKRV